MSYLKITAMFLLFVFIVGGAYYMNVLGSLKNLVSESNEGFIAYLPTEAIGLIIILIFGILMSLAYSFFGE